MGSSEESSEDSSDSSSRSATPDVQPTSTQAELLALLQKLIDLIVSDTVPNVQDLPEVCRRLPARVRRGSLQ
jgi:hypothetical protein